MNDNHDVLASEYVLGTLQGDERLQFERLMRDNDDIRQRVYEWETRLFPLADGIVPVKPRKRVWKSIHRRIQPLKSPGVWSHPGWWRAWGLAASLMLVVISVYVLQIQQPPVHIPPAVAVLSNPSSQAGWIVQADYNNNFITVQTLTVADPGKKRAYELWMLPEGQSPRSLGLLPLKGKRSVKLTSETRASLKQSAALAVSLEPSTGSPTGLPTGPIRYQGRILKIQDI